LLEAKSAENEIDLELNRITRLILELLSRARENCPDRDGGTEKSIGDHLAWEARLLMIACILG